MGRISEKWGDNVENAVELALQDLKCERSQVTVTVLEEPSRGFLGIGSKLAKVRVETIEEEKTNEKNVATEEAFEKAFRKEKPAQTKKKKNKKEKQTGRTADRGEEERGSGKEEKRVRRVPLEIDLENLEPVEEHEALDFLRSTTEKMGLDLQFKAGQEGENLYIEIMGEDAGAIIGKRGQTLDAIQYLTSLAVNRERDDYLRVILNAENYRAKREKTLEQLAKRLANKVVKSRRSVRLEPMNSYERMVIHATLQSNPKVTTRSEGEEPYRRVIIEFKK